MGQKEGEEKSKPLQYNSLSEPLKVKSILGSILEAVPKQLVIDMSGVRYDELDEKIRAQIDETFAGEEINISNVDGEDRYILKDEARNKLKKTVDLESAENVIINFWMKYHGLE